MKVYLAGPIAGLTLKKALVWRTVTETILNEAGFEVLNPLRGIRFSPRVKIRSTLDTSDPRRSDKAIVGRGLADIYASDIVLFNFEGVSAVSVGSCVEIGFCHALRKFAVVVLDSGSAYDHSFIREMGPVFANLAEAIEFLVTSIPRSGHR